MPRLEAADEPDDQLALREPERSAQGSTLVPPPSTVQRVGVRSVRHDLHLRGTGGQRPGGERSRDRKDAGAAQCILLGGGRLVDQGEREVAPPLVGHGRVHLDDPRESTLGCQRRAGAGEEAQPLVEPVGPTGVEQWAHLVEETPTRPDPGAIGVLAGPDRPDVDRDHLDVSGAT